MADWTCKAGDTATALEGTLERKGVPVDLTGAVVRFYMESVTGPIIDRAIPVASPATGVVLVGFNEDEISAPGTYRAEFRVTYGDGRKETFPNFRHLSIRILPH